MSAWGEVAKTYTRLHFDVFILDYRGFGKSEGSISSQSQIFKDVQIAYDSMLKYKFETDKYIKDCKMPVVIFHGDRDEVIYYGSSLKLKEQLKRQDTLITLIGQGHNGMTNNPDYETEIQKILKRE